MVAGPIDARAMGVEVPIEYRPATAATERVAERAEQLLPARVRTVGLRQHAFGLRARRLAVAAEVPEVQLVQDHRVGELELGGLEPRDGEAGCVGGHLRQLFLDLVQVLDRASVVVVVVRYEQLLGQPRQLFRVERQRLDHVLAEEGVAERRGVATLAARLRDRRAAKKHASHQDVSPGHHVYSQAGLRSKNSYGRRAWPTRARAAPKSLDHL